MESILGRTEWPWAAEKGKETIINIKNLDAAMTDCPRLGVELDCPRAKEGPSSYVVDLSTRLGLQIKNMSKYLRLKSPSAIPAKAHEWYIIPSQSSCLLEQTRRLHMARKMEAQCIHWYTSQTRAEDFSPIQHCVCWAC